MGKFHDCVCDSIIVHSERLVRYSTSKINELNVYGDGICENLERSLILVNMDRIWREHLQKMTLLREAVGWRGYGQKNPLYEYKQDAFYMFENRKEILRHLVIYDLLRAYIL